MANKYNVTYTGTILSGFDEKTVKLEVVQLLKLPPGKVDAFFSGQSVTIKKNIELESALKIQTVLISKGLSIQITEDRSNPPVMSEALGEKPMFELVKDEPAPIPEVKSTPASALHERRTALATGVVAPMARKSPNKSHQEHRLADNQKVWEDEDEEEDDQPAIVMTPPFIGLSFDGRYGRLNFVNATSLFFVSLILFFIVFAYLPFFFASLFLMPVYFFYRHLALRCHDLNLPSFVALLIWVPYVDLLFLLALLLVPGKKGSNDYGPPSEQGPIWGLVGLGVVSIVLTYTYVTFVSTMMGYYTAYEDYEKNKIPAEEVALVAKPFMAYLLDEKYTEALALTSKKFQTLNESGTLKANLGGFKFSNNISKLTLNEAASEYEYFYIHENKEKTRFGGALMVLDGESKEYQPTQAAITLLLISEDNVIKIHDVNFNDSYYGDSDDDYADLDDY